MYERFYGLSAPPFQLTPDPRLLFEARDHRRALSYLRYGLQRREGLVIVTGHVGTGKTLLLQSMLSDLRDQHLTIARVALANMDGPAVMPSVAAAFGVEADYRSKYDLMEALVQRLAPNRTRGALLIVDEAQACSTAALEELRTLSNLQANGQALVQIFLIGQTELRDTMARSDMAHMRQRVVASHHLKPLDKTEVAEYVEHRLKRVGCNGPPYFGDSVFERVYTWSTGIPRRINLIMDRLLLYGYLENKHELDRDDLDTVIGEFEEEFPDERVVASATEAQPPHPAAQTRAENGAQSQALAEISERIAFLEQVVRAKYGAAETNALLARFQSRSEARAIAEARQRLDDLEQTIAEFGGEAAGAEAKTAQSTAPAQAGPAASDRPDPPPAADDPAAAETGQTTDQGADAEPTQNGAAAAAYRAEEPANASALALEDWIPSKMMQDQLALHRSADADDDAEDDRHDARASNDFDVDLVEPAASPYKDTAANRGTPSRRAARGADERSGEGRALYSRLRWKTR